MRIILELNVPAERQSTEDLIVTSALIGTLHDRILEEGYELPEVIKTGAREVKQVLDARLAADRERQLEILKKRRMGLATAEEKRGLLDKEIEDLETRMGIRPAAAQTAGA